MRNLKKSPARRWFINNINDLKSNMVPKSVLTDLTSYPDEDIFELACEMIDFRLYYKFEEHKGVDLQTDEEIFIEDNEYDNFLAEFQVTNFPDLANPNEMVDFLIDKLSVILNILVMCNRGDLILQNSFQVWDVVERRAELLCTKSRKTKKTYKVKHKWNPGQSEVSVKSLIEQAVVSGNYKLAKKLKLENDSIIERMNE